MASGLWAAADTRAMVPGLSGRGDREGMAGAGIRADTQGMPAKTSTRDAPPRRGEGDGMIAAEPRMNYPPSDFRSDRDLPKGFAAFYSPLHAEFTPRQRDLVARRAASLREAHAGRLPEHLPPSDATRLD